MSYSDEYLDYWGDVFVRLGLYPQHGVLFETFLLYPQEIVQACAQHDPHATPLLPRQAEAMHAQMAQERMDDDAVIDDRVPDVVVITPSALRRWCELEAEA